MDEDAHDDAWTQEQLNQLAALEQFEAATAPTTAVKESAFVVALTSLLEKIDDIQASREAMNDGDYLSLCNNLRDLHTLCATVRVERVYVEMTRRVERRSVPRASKQEMMRSFPHLFSVCERCGEWLMDVGDKHQSTKKCKHTWNLRKATAFSGRIANSRPVRISTVANSVGISVFDRVMLLEECLVFKAGEPEENRWRKVGREKWVSNTSK